LHAWGVGGSWTTLAGAGLVLALRLAAIYWKLSLPVFEAR
jgi:uncharacterized membrane protein YeiH